MRGNYTGLHLLRFKLLLLKVTVAAYPHLLIEYNTNFSCNAWQYSRWHPTRHQGPLQRGADYHGHPAGGLHHAAL